MLTYRIGGKQRQMTLKSKNLKEARSERDVYKAIIKQGKDPVIERTLQLDRVRQLQRDEQEAIAKLQARVTVTNLFDRWRDTDLIKRKDRDEVTRMFNKDVLPILGDLFVDDVRKKTAKTVRLTQFIYQTLHLRNSTY